MVSTGSGQTNLLAAATGASQPDENFYRRATAFARFARLGGELEKRHPAQPHRYLSALGVSLAWHAQGVGSALLKLGTARADARGIPCHLETFSEANVRFYRQHGFDVVGQGNDLIPGGPPFWFMVRPAEIKS